MVCKKRAFNLKDEASAGFTLLEVLVVMILLSMVMSMLMQGLSMIYGLRGRILVQIDEQRVNRLQEQLVTDLVSGLTPDYPKANAVFVGSKDGFYGLSMHSMQDDVGVPIQVRLWGDSTRDGSRLLYRQQGLSEIVMGTYSSTDIRFSYMNAKGEMFQNWPLAGGLSPQLPQAVIVKFGTDVASPTWYLPVLARTQPRATVQDILN